MKKIALIAMTAAAAFATPAMADVTGTINITGSVAAKCMVVSGTSVSSTFGATVAMGELAQADGTLKSSATLEGQFNGGVTGGALTAHVVCTSADATVTVDANPLVSPSGNLAPSGYTNTVNYQADVTFTKTTGDKLVTNDSTAAAATSDTLGGRFAATSTNISVATSNWRTAPGDLLTSGTDYAGSIVVTVSPL